MGVVKSFMRHSQFNIDCEGPITKNDNAFELSSFFIPDGDKFFALISKYDDFLADIERKPGYKAGDTLKLILPFLKAFGVTDKKMEDYSRANILLIPGAKEMLHYIMRIMPVYIISTSYEPYLHALCSVADFSFSQVYCTKVSIDLYPLEKEERLRLESLVLEMLTMTMIELPVGIERFEELPVESQDTIKRLNEIFWREIIGMKIGRILLEINPVGGMEKARAILDSLAKTGCGLSELVYVGDSITDVQAFNLVREGEGLAIAFNGNRYAVSSAEICCLSPHASVLSLLAELFYIGGKTLVLKASQNWDTGFLKSLDLNKDIVSEIECRFGENLPRVEVISDKNREELIHASEEYRKQVRGVAIGMLG
ncbi:MAG: hypothetical protein AB1488_01575 [Nitrospirota bacterium]